MYIFLINLLCCFKESLLVSSAKLYATIDIIIASKARYDAETMTKTNYENLRIQILPPSHRKQRLG